MNRGDLRSLCLHQAVSARWADMPEWRSRTRSKVTGWTEAADPSLQHWGREFQRLLDRPATELWAELLAITDRGQQLRSVSPMAVLVPKDVRRRILEETRDATP